MTAFGELLLDFEHLDRGMSQRLGSGTPRAVLVGVVDARLATGKASLTEVASASGLALGTVKASRSRVEGLREAMDEIGRGPREWPNLGEENAAVARFWRNRSPDQRQAWIEAVGCETLHRLFDADEANDYVNVGMTFFQHVPARRALTRLWGADQAPYFVELIEIGHRAVEDPLPWQREAVS
jgi:hypothetical protein